MSQTSRWRGLASLIVDTVEHGASAIERVHLATLRRPFAVLEHVPGLALPARALHSLMATHASATYGTVRAVARAVGDVAHFSLTLTSEADEGPPEPSE